MTPTLIAIATGSRDWLDRKSVYTALDALGPDLLIHGSMGRRTAPMAKRGTDLIAQEWAERRGVSVLAAPPLWEVHGRAAGPLRNKLMLWVGQSLARESGARLVVAALPGSTRADEGLMQLALAASIDVVEHEYDGSVRRGARPSGGQRLGP